MFLRKMLSNYSRKQFAQWLIVSIIAGFYLSLVIPIKPPVIPVPARVNIELTATGEKGPQAEDSQVYLVALFKGKSQRPVSSGFTNQAGWEEVSQGWSAEKIFPARLNWVGRANGKIRLVFESGPQSGVVKIRYGEFKSSLDLYKDSPGQYEIEIPLINRYTKMLNILSFSIFSIALGFGIFLMVVFLVSRPAARFSQAEEKNGSQDRKDNNPWVILLGWLKYAIPMLVAWPFYLVGFWPGLMSPDSFVSWGQALTGNYENWQPPIYALYIRLITRIWESPGAVVIVGTLLAIFLISLGIWRLEKNGVHKALCWAPAVLLAVFPTVGIMNLVLWKDVIYNFLLLAVTIMAFEIMITSGRWLDSRLSLTWIVLTGLLLSLLRHNGLPVYLLILCCLMLIYRYHWKTLVVSIVLIVGLWYLINGPLYDRIGVVRNDAVLKSGLAVHQIAAHLKANTPLIDAEKELLAQVRPVEDDWTYNCLSVNYTLFHPDYNVNYVKDHQLDLIKIAMTLALRRPQVTWNHYLCVGSLAYRVTTDPKAYLYTGPLEYDEDLKLRMPGNPFGIELTRPNEKLSESLGELWQFTREPGVSWFFWRPALFFYVILFGACIQALRAKDWHWVVVVIPLIVSTATSFIVIQAQDARYYYGSILIGLMYIPFMLFNRDNQLIKKKATDAMANRDLQSPK